MACYNPYYITRVGISSPLKTAKKPGGCPWSLLTWPAKSSFQTTLEVIMSHDCVFFFKMDFPGWNNFPQFVNLIGSMDDWYIYKHLPSKSSIHVGKYTIPWILCESASSRGHTVLFLGRSILDHGLKGRNSTTWTTPWPTQVLEMNAFIWVTPLLRPLMVFLLAPWNVGGRKPTVYLFRLLVHCSSILYYLTWDVSQIRTAIDPEMDSWKTILFFKRGKLLLRLPLKVLWRPIFKGNLAQLPLYG